jgi:hypothetical protein
MWRVLSRGATTSLEGELPKRNARRKLHAAIAPVTTTLESTAIMRDFEDYRLFELAEDREPEFRRDVTVRMIHRRPIELRGRRASHQGYRGESSGVRRAQSGQTSGVHTGVFRVTSPSSTRPFVARKGRAVLTTTPMLVWGGQSSGHFI